MSTVYRALHKQLNRTVALKVLNLNFAVDPDFIKRFELEARTIAKLDHENLVRIYDFGNQSDYYYIAMEIVNGPDLLHILKNNGPIPWEVVAIIFQRICFALDQAHKKHIIHRDIKLQNILIKEDGTPKLSDFGIAKTEDIEGMTRTNDIVGTPSYISPELICGKPPTHQSDIYAIGICLYHALSGQYPFEAPNMASLFHMIVSKPVSPLESIGVSVPAEVSEFVTRCLQKEPCDRYGDAAQAAWALSECLARQNVSNALTVVQDYMKNPYRYVRETRGAMINNLLHTADKLSKTGNIFGALKIYKEVLGLDPSNREVEKNIEQLSKQLPADKGLAREQREKTRLLNAKRRSRAPAVLVAALAVIAGAWVLFSGLYREKQPVPQQAVQPAPVIVSPAVPKPAPDSAGNGLRSRAKAKMKAKVNVKAAPPPVLEPVVEAQETTQAMPVAVTEAPPCSGSLSIYSGQWSYVNIDDAKYGKAPTRQPIRLPCGNHRIRLVRPTGEEYRAELAVQGNGPLELKIREDEYR